MSISNMSREILKWISKYIKKQLESQDSQTTSQEIAEIVNKAISSYNEVNKQTTEESNLYQTQIIQMLKDLTNKVDRLKSVLQKKEITERATQSTIQTFANGLHTSKKVNIENILKKDLEPEDNALNSKKLGNENIVDKNKNNGTPLHTSEVNNTNLESIGEKNQQSTTKRQIVVNTQNQEIKKLDLKTVMKGSRKTTNKLVDESLSGKQQ